MSKIVILILNWNGKHFLERFLPSVLTHSPKELADIIIADNGSTDDSLPWLQSSFPEVQILAFEKNLGFAGGYNQAIAQCQHEFILLLNSDVEVSPNWLLPLIEGMNNPQVAAVMPKILSWGAREEFEYAGAAGGFIDRFGYPFCRGRLFDHRETDYGQHDASLEVHWTTGACMLVRRKVFNSVGGFDSDFFAHMEEIDLCWRMRLKGYQLLCLPDSKVYHVGGGSLPNESPRKLFLNFRNNLYLLYKNLPDGQVFTTIFSRLLLDGIAALNYLLSGKVQFVRAILKAHWSFFGQIPTLKIKRKELKPGKSRVKLYPKSIVYQYFLKGKKHFEQLDYK